MQEQVPDRIHGFVVETDQGYKISPCATSSVLANELLLRRIIEVAYVAKGALLDVGSGDRPYYGIFHPRVTSYVSIDLLASQHAARPTVYADVFPQLAYLRLRKVDFDDEAFTIGHVLIATKQRA